jgi:hypothetical protein
MKLIAGITLVICLLSCGLKAQPKPLPDSIRLEYPDYHALLTFELRQYEENKSIIRNFPAQLANIVKHIKSSITATDQAKPHRVEVLYAEEKGIDQYTLQLSAISDPDTKVTVSEKTIVELLPPGWEVHVRMKQAEIRLYVPDLEQLEQLSGLNMEPVIAQLDKDPETHRQQRFGIISRIIVAGGQVQSTQTSHRLPNDMLGLHAGAGLGLVHERFYPEFNFALSFYLANRYKENHQRISAHYELKLFTGRTSEGDYLTQPASFLSVSYALNFGKDRPRWTGLGAGFLVHNRSDVFRGNTLKLFIESDIGSPKLNIIPELYLTDDYKRSVFGIKLNYKF